MSHPSYHRHFFFFNLFYITASQVTEVAGKLNSEDVFVLATPATVFLWKGEERRIYILKEISLNVSVTVSYSTFDNSFLSGTGSLPSEASVGLKIANILASLGKLPVPDRKELSKVE